MKFYKAIILYKTIILDQAEKYGKDAIRIIYYYILCIHHFKDNAGYFTINKIINHLGSTHGHKSLINDFKGLNRRKKFKDIEYYIQLSDLFSHVKDDIYKINSSQKARRKGTMCRRFKLHPNLLHKNNWKDFKAYYIYMFADYQQINHTLLTKLTGFNRACIWHSIQRLIDKGEVIKIKRLIAVESYESKKAAYDAMRAVYKKVRTNKNNKKYKIFTTVIENRNYNLPGSHILCINGSNSYRSMQIGRKGLPSLAENTRKKAIKKESERCSTNYETINKIDECTHLCVFKESDFGEGITRFKQRVGGDTTTK